MWINSKKNELVAFHQAFLMFNAKAHQGTAQTSLSVG